MYQYKSSLLYRILAFYFYCCAKRSFKVWAKIIGKYTLFWLYLTCHSIGIRDLNHDSITNFKLHPIFFITVPIQILYRLLSKFWPHFLTPHKDSHANKNRAPGDYPESNRNEIGFFLDLNHICSKLKISFSNFSRYKLMLTL